MSWEKSLDKDIFPNVIFPLKLFHHSMHIALLGIGIPSLLEVLLIPFLERQKVAPVAKAIQSK